MSVKNQHEYVPNKLRARPLYFYQLPVYVLFISMMYWLVVCPLAYYFFFRTFEHTPSLVVPFFIFSLTLYLIVLGILLCIWRCRNDNTIVDANKNKDGLIYTKICTKIHKDKLFVPLQPKSSTIYNKDSKCSCNKNNCSFCWKKEDKTPKKLLLNENTFETDNCVVKQQCSSPTEEREYFIANVSSPKVCTSEVFLFVEESKPQEEFVEVSIIKEILED